jgi:hypothetical protein
MSGTQKYPVYIDKASHNQKKPTGTGVKALDTGR